MTLDLNQLHVESFETGGSAQVMGGPFDTREVDLCASRPADGTLALMQGVPTEDPDYC